MKGEIARVGEAPFAERVTRLPYLGLGISTEFGARHGGLDLFALRAEHPQYARFLEVGCDLERGVDEDARRWASERLPTTYHFLDVNLEEGDDLDADWVRDASSLARSIGAAWMCGDAGLWHVGPRERGHGVLAPPVLEESSARELARNVARLRRASGFEVLPENAPAHVYLGRMHLCDYLALVAEEGDCGLLLDVAHLAVYQRVKGLSPFEGFERLPFDRVVELHVAGGRPFTTGGVAFVEDDHGVAILPETWELLEAVLERAPNVRALVFECERNPIGTVVPIFERLADWLECARARGEGEARARPPRAAVPVRAPPLGVVRALQRTLFRMQADAVFARSILARDERALATSGLAPADARALFRLDARALGADPDGRRRAQILGNVLSEYRLVHENCRQGGRDEGFLGAFLSAAEFHAAMRTDGRLPLAFGAWAERRASEVGDELLGALASLEHAMARLRRRTVASVVPPGGQLQLSARAELLVLPRGTHALAVEMRARLEGDTRGGARSPWRGGQRETVLLYAAPRPSPHRLAEVEVEVLVPPVDVLLEFLREGREARALAEFAREHDAAAEDLARLIAEWRGEGVLIAGEGFGA